VSDLSRLYREAITRHAAHPVGYRRQIDSTHRHEEYNPLCGDRVLVRLRIVRDRVEAAAFDGEACAICMASASLLCENVPGRPVSHLENLHDRLQAALDGTAGNEGPEELMPLLGVKPFPSRIRCATLPWDTARKAL
jgi:nitrogen fixation NifU-like protein